MARLGLDKNDVIASCSQSEHLLIQRQMNRARQRAEEKNRVEPWQLHLMALNSHHELWVASRAEPSREFTDVNVDVDDLWQQAVSQ